MNNIIHCLVEYMLLSKISKTKYNKHNQLILYKNKENKSILNYKSFNINKHLIYSKIENIYDINSLELLYINYNYTI